jgi:UDP-N-acetylglucosamine transferase subunit ALG13
VVRADVVISHSGVGSAIRVLELGKTPILVPREARFDEHVDDHQGQICEHLGRRGLCQHARVEDLAMHHVERAFGRVVAPVPPVQSEPA